MMALFGKPVAEPSSEASHGLHIRLLYLLFPHYVLALMSM
jgi:hypothetical protein